MFPNNTLGPPAPPPPSPELQSKIKHDAAASLFKLLPPSVTRTYYASTDEQVIINRIESDLLDPFQDQYLNKHLVYEILELLLLRLIPELGEQSVGELLAERGVGGYADDGVGLQMEGECGTVLGRGGYLVVQGPSCAGAVMDCR